MAHALEVRSPFLDPDVVAFALALPPRERWAWGKGKRVVRRAMADVLPPDYRAFQAYLQGMVQGPALAVGKEARALAAQILRPPLPRPARAAGPFMRAVTAWLLPERLRGQFGLEPATRDRLVLALLTGGLRASLRALPARARFWPHYLVARRRMEDFGNE